MNSESRRIVLQTDAKVELLQRERAVQSALITKLTAELAEAKAASEKDYTYIKKLGADIRGLRTELAEAKVEIEKLDKEAQA